MDKYLDYPLVIPIIVMNVMMKELKLILMYSST